MSDSRWITEKREDVAKLLVDAMHMIGQQRSSSLLLDEQATSHRTEAQSIHCPTHTQVMINTVPALKLEKLTSPSISPNISFQSTPNRPTSPEANCSTIGGSDSQNDVVPRLHFKTSPEKRCTICRYVCANCGNPLQPLTPSSSVRDDINSISVFSDRSNMSHTSSTDSARMLLNNYNGEYNQRSGDEKDAQFKKKAFIENSILRSTGLNVVSDDTKKQTKQLATLKDSLRMRDSEIMIANQAVRKEPSSESMKSERNENRAMKNEMKLMHKNQTIRDQSSKDKMSASSSTMSQDGEMISICCVEPGDYLEDMRKEAVADGERRKKTTQTRPMFDSRSDERIVNEIPHIFKKKNLRIGSEEKIIASSNSATNTNSWRQTSPMRSMNPNPVMKYKVYPTTSDAVKLPNPDDMGQPRRVSLGFTMTHPIDDSLGQSSEDNTSQKRTSSFKRLLRSIWKK